MVQRILWMQQDRSVITPSAQDRRFTQDHGHQRSFRAPWIPVAPSPIDSTSRRERAGNTRIPQNAADWRMALLIVPAGSKARAVVKHQLPALIRVLKAREASMIHGHPIPGVRR